MRNWIGANGGTERERFGCEPVGLGLGSGVGWVGDECGCVPHIHYVEYGGFFFP